MTKKRSQQSLFYFLPLYYLTKGREGVHFRQGGVHFLIIPKTYKRAASLQSLINCLSESQSERFSKRLV